MCYNCYADPLSILKPGVHEQFLCNDFHVTNIVCADGRAGNICNSSKLWGHQWLLHLYTQFKLLWDEILENLIRLVRDSNPWPLQYRCSVLPCIKRRWNVSGNRTVASNHTPCSSHNFSWTLLQSKFFSSFGPWGMTKLAVVLNVISDYWGTNWSEIIILTSRRKGSWVVMGLLGCFPLCQTARSEISGNTWGKWTDIFRLNRANQ